MMLLCCSFASASFTSRNPSSLSVDRLNSKIYTICRSSLIATPSGSPAPETIYEERSWIEVVPSLLTFCDWYCHLCILCLLRQLFPAADWWKIFSSPRRAHVTFFVKRDKLELAFVLLCSMHAVMQVPSPEFVTTHSRIKSSNKILYFHARRGLDMLNKNSLPSMSSILRVLTCVCRIQISFVVPSNRFGDMSWSCFYYVQKKIAELMSVHAFTHW